MNESFLDALTTWQTQGRRQFTIKVGNLSYATNETTVEVSCYDADIGIFVYPKCAAEVTDTNMIEERKRSLRESITRCSKELEVLDAN